MAQLPPRSNVFTGQRPPAGRGREISFPDEEREEVTPVPERTMATREPVQMSGLTPFDVPSWNEATEEPLGAKAVVPMAPPSQEEYFDVPAWDADLSPDGADIPAEGRREEEDLPAIMDRQFKGLGPEESGAFTDILDAAVGGGESARAMPGVFQTIEGVEVPMMRADTQAGREWNKAVFEAKKGDPEVVRYLAMARQRYDVVRAVTGRNYQHSDLMGIDAVTTEALGRAFETAQVRPASMEERADSLAVLAETASGLQDLSGQAIIIEALMSMMDFQDSGAVDQITNAAERTNLYSPMATALRGAREQSRAQRREAAPQRSPIQSLTEVEAEVRRDQEMQRLHHQRKRRALEESITL